MLEVGRELPEVSTYDRYERLESSKNQEKVKTMSNVMEAPTSNLGNTNEPTLDHTPITTDLMSYKFVRDGHALEQKVSDVSTTFHLFAA